MNIGFGKDWSAALDSGCMHLIQPSIYLYVQSCFCSGIQSRFGVSGRICAREIEAGWRPVRYLCGALSLKNYMLKTDTTHCCQARRLSRISRRRDRAGLDKVLDLVNPNADSTER